MALTARDIPFDHNPLDITSREFKFVSDGCYELLFLPAGIKFAAQRVAHRRGGELHGDLVVSIDGNFPTAKTTNGVLSSGALNFSSVNARSQRAKLLYRRAGSLVVDFEGLLEEFCVRVIEADRVGEPAIDLSTWTPPPGQEKDRIVNIAGFPILLDHPNLIYSEGGAGKSYFAMYIAGCLAQMEIPVLYCDWEFSMDSHGRRFMEMFRPRPKGLHYIRCERPMLQEADRIVKLIAFHKIGFVICDSMGYASEGRIEEAENANNYFRVVRSFRLGSLHLSHVSKRDDEHKGSAPIGSIYWLNSVRYAWFLQRAQENPENQLSFSLTHKKHNTSGALSPRAFTLTFDRDGVTTLSKSSIQDIKELADTLPLHERMKKYLEKKGATAPKDVAEDLGVTVAAVRLVVHRHDNTFTKLGKKIGVSHGF